MDYAVDPGFESIRTTLQSALAFPFVACVTSSAAHDGKTEVAVGTARAFARAGFETLVVDANPLAPGVGAALGLGPINLPDALDSTKLTIKKAGGLLEATSIASCKVADDAKAAEISALAQHFRSTYKVTIVDLSELFYGAFCVSWAAAADGVIIAARYARLADDEDRSLVATLQRAGATIIGSVPTGYPSAL